MQKVIGANIYVFSMSDYEDDSADHHQLGRFRGDWYVSLEEWTQTPDNDHEFYYSKVANLAKILGNHSWMISFFYDLAYVLVHFLEAYFW